MKTETVKKCERCEKSFVSIRKNHLCCSPKCSSKNYQEKKMITNLSQGLILDAYAQNDPLIIDEPIVREYVLEECPLEVKPEIVNEFHELTEKELNKSKRKNRVKYFTRDIVDYIIIRLELDKKIEEFHPQEILDDLVRYDIINLSLKDLHFIIPELVKHSKGYFTIDYSFFHKLELVNKFSDNLTNYIIEEDKLPTEEQLAKSGLLKMMITEIRQIMALTTKTKEPNKDVFAGVLEMIDDLYVLVNRKFDSLNQKIDRAIMISEQNVFISNNANIRYDSFEKQLQLLSEKIDKIKIKRGLFG